MSEILVVDDDRELRDNLREVLSAEGFDVVVAGNGDEALEMVKTRAFDLVLLDLVMPGLSGLETLLLLRRQQPQLKVVMVTAFSTIENAVEAMRRGADDYLTKPFKISDLLMTVKRVLEEARFKECNALLNMDGTFNSLANAIRRQILLVLKSKGRRRFMEVTRDLGIDDHTKVNFHLKVLKEEGLISQDDQKYYSLSPKGVKVTQCMNIVIDNMAH